MKIGLLITTYNRPEYLKQCLNSLFISDRSTLHKILIVDDASTNPEVKEVLMKSKSVLNSTIYISAENKGIAHSIKSGAEFLFDKFECDVVINLDPDTLVKPDWIAKLTALYQRFPTSIISGFNTLSKSVGAPKPRHDVHEWHDDYVTKSTIGGINMMFSYSMYHKIIKYCLVPKDWDWLVCKEFQSRYWLFVVTRPSVVQHIGVGEGMHMSDNPDVAQDF